MRKAHITIRLRAASTVLYLPRSGGFSTLLSVKLNFQHLSEVMFSEPYRTELSLHFHQVETSIMWLIKHGKQSKEWPQNPLPDIHFWQFPPWSCGCLMSLCFSSVAKVHRARVCKEAGEQCGSKESLDPSSSTNNKFWVSEDERKIISFTSLFLFLTFPRANWHWGKIPLKNRVKEKQGFLQFVPPMCSSFLHFVRWSFSHLWSNPS